MSLGNLPGGRYLAYICPRVSVWGHMSVGFLSSNPFPYFYITINIDTTVLALFSAAQLLFI